MLLACLGEFARADGAMGYISWWRRRSEEASWKAPGRAGADTWRASGSGSGQWEWEWEWEWSVRRELDFDSAALPAHQRILFNTEKGF